jgi:hypothetical protein
MWLALRLLPRGDRRRDRPELATLKRAIEPPIVNSSEDGHRDRPRRLAVACCCD